MSHAKKKFDWCLRKAERELKESDKHRGIVKVEPDMEAAKNHITKAEHYLKATDYLKKGDFSDISTSTVFYSMYHCLLAISIKFGYESRNQECTFALIYSLIEDKKIAFEEKLLNKITSLNPKDNDEKHSIQLREQFQYGTSLSIEDTVYAELFELEESFIDRIKEKEKIQKEIEAKKASESKT